MSATEIMLIVITAVAGNVLAIYILRKKFTAWMDLQIRALQQPNELASKKYDQLQERIKPLIIEHLRRNSTRSRIKKS